MTYVIARQVSRFCGEIGGRYEDDASCDLKITYQKTLDV